tara:strand:- start:486 stop:1295 length:810 start_codon:yes stop_codon:yes gene_type:complete
MSDFMAPRINLEEFLLTEKERVSLESPIYKGFSFLVDILVESDSWERGPVPGQISFEYSPQSHLIENYLSLEDEDLEPVGKMDIKISLQPVNVVLDLRATLGKNFLNNRDRHLEVIVSSKSTGRSTNACIVGSGSTKDAPITDDCASFILWALSGFMSPPYSLIMAIIEVTDSEEYDNFRARRLDNLQNRRLLRLRTELLRQTEIERRRNFEYSLEVNISRLIGMTWAELAQEHRDSGVPNDRLGEELYRYRENLLSPMIDDNDLFLNL